MAEDGSWVLEPSGPDGTQIWKLVPGFDGRVHIIDTGDRYFEMSTNGTWSAPYQLCDHNPSLGPSADIDVDVDGVVHAVCDKDGEVMYFSRSAGGQWEEPFSLSADNIASSLGSPKIATGRDFVFAAWTDARLANQRQAIDVRVMDGDGIWSEATQISDEPRDEELSKLILDMQVANDDILFLLWKVTEQPTTTITIKSFNPITNAPRDEYATTGIDGMLVPTDQNEIHAVVGTERSLLHSVRTSNDNWSPLQLITEYTEPKFRTVAVADESGSLYTSWVQAIGGPTYAMFAAYRDESQIYLPFIGN